jgi:hypothetical protein
MTQDEIIEMARQAGFEDFVRWSERYPHEVQRWVERMEAFAKLVAAKEREACAGICMETEQRFTELLNKFFYTVDAGGVLAASQCVNAIRARGEA